MGKGRCSCGGTLALLLCACLATAQPGRLSDLESTYADLLDAFGVITAIDSGLFDSYRGKDRAAWNGLYRKARQRVAAGLPSTHERAVTLMRRSLDSDLPKDPGHSALDDPLYASFNQVGNHLHFENSSVTRLQVFDLLSHLADPQRRKKAFLALSPLWEAINGHNHPGSPYRRRIRAAAAGRRHDAAARTLGVPEAEVERWLEQILDTWRQVSGNQPVEPWDYYYRNGAADRLLGDSIPRESLLPVTQRYYRDLGADLQRLGVLYDLDPRPGKDPVAYTARVIVGRWIDGLWHPAIARVSASYSGGGLSSLNELVHENGHAIHETAIRTRPAFADLGDSVFVEAFADVPAWETYDPQWQRKYLGRAAPAGESLRSQYSGVMLDVAWALFEVRLLRKPESDPNLVWTTITSRYLHIVPHQDWSWWAVRGQLVDPGYMVNYGLGAVVTADLRQHITTSLGAFHTGDPRWYGWLSDRLLRFGTERETSESLRAFLGRPVSLQPLLKDIERLNRRDSLNR